MPKERSVNPAQAQRKAEKQREISKNKKNLQHQRNEKLARRNPERLQRQIEELKESEARGSLRPKDKDTLAQLEKDLKGVRRARDALGDAAPKFPIHDRPERREPRSAREEQQQRRQHLGKRRRAQDETHSDSEDTDPEVRDIPMPRDTPPPISRDSNRRPFRDPQIGPDGHRIPHALPTKPVAAVAPQVVYSSAPQLRDLKKEATKFVPSAVRQKQKQVKGTGGRLLEADEIDRLEKAGYYAANQAAQAADLEARFDQAAHELAAKAPDVDMDEEMKRFEQEIGSIHPFEDEKLPSRTVAVEEVEDAGD